MIETISKNFPVTTRLLDQGGKVFHMFLAGIVLIIIIYLFRNSSYYQGNDNTNDTDEVPTNTNDTTKKEGEQVTTNETNATNDTNATDATKDKEATNATDTTDENTEPSTSTKAESDGFVNIDSSSK